MPGQTSVSRGLACWPFQGICSSKARLEGRKTHLCLGEVGRVSGHTRASQFRIYRSACSLGGGARPKSKRGCTVSHRLGKGWGAGARERCGTYICRLDCGRSCGPALSSVSTRSPFSLQHLLTCGRMGSAAPPFRNAHLYLFLLVCGPSVFLSGLPLRGDFTCSLLWRRCEAGLSLMVFFGMVRVWPEVAGCTARPRQGGRGAVTGNLGTT